MTSGKATVNGIELNYQIDGPEDGIPVVFCNSLATNLSMWDPQIPALTDRYRVLRFDKRGHGNSATFDTPIEIKTLADDVVALADHLDFLGGHFCGLSIGGMTGQALGIFHSGAFKSLSLCATSSAIPTSIHAVWDERMAKVRAEGMEPMVDPTLERWFSEKHRDAHPDTVASIGDMIRQTSPTGYIRCSEAIVKMGFTDQVGSITTPTIVMPGALDPALPPAMSEVIHAGIAGSTYSPIADAAHLCNLEQPEAFNQTLRGWLDQNS